MNIWSTNKWEKLKNLDFEKRTWCHQKDPSDSWNRVNNMKFSIDDKTLVISKKNEINNDYEITIWSPDITGLLDNTDFFSKIFITKLQTIKCNLSVSRHCETGHMSSTIDLSSDGIFLATGSHKEAQIWLMKDGTLFQTITNYHEIKKLAFSPDAKILAISSKGTNRIMCYECNGIEWVLTKEIPR